MLLFGFDVAAEQRVQVGALARGAQGPSRTPPMEGKGPGSGGKRQEGQGPGSPWAPTAPQEPGQLRWGGTGQGGLPGWGQLCPQTLGEEILWGAGSAWGTKPGGVTARGQLWDTHNDEGVEQGPVERQEADDVCGSALLRGPLQVWGGTGGGRHGTVTSPCDMGSGTLTSPQVSPPPRPCHPIQQPYGVIRQ